jgi:GxxExxY protein
MDDAARAALNELSYSIIGAAIEVHKALGPGLLESVYRACMVYELESAGIAVVAEQIVSIHYKDIVLECGYRLDLLVENQIM